jgi:ATP-binding cassette subfamily B protein
VLQDFDLTLPAGTSLAVVGANGAGKTTLVKLLCRLYDPDRGRITIDGVDLRDLDITSWRDRIAAVFQDSLRLELPARLNVGYGRPHAADDLDAVRAAAEIAGVADVIDALPNGWETPLSAEYSGGADLSGGEWQKLGLARAMFAVRHGADVLVLDEPAAHFDARSEADLYERFLLITEGVTTIVISHRFSTVRQASTIVVVDEGRVVEKGAHAQLVAAGGRYAEMFQLQASRFVAADRTVEP